MLHGGVKERCEGRRRMNGEIIIIIIVIIMIMRRGLYVAIMYFYQLMLCKYRIIYAADAINTMYTSLWNSMGTK